MNDLEKPENIKTRADLSKFLNQLSMDCRDNPRSWENDTLESFLRALAAWTEDMDGYYTNRGQPVPVVPEWKTLAEMLMGARCYE
jgi:hypothetical protein